MHAVVVTWNGAHLLADCLGALLAQRCDARVHTVVVDNASADGTADLLASRFPSVEHLRLPENQGYGRANNYAMRRALQAGADFLALINNDVELEPGWLAALLAAARAHPEAGLFNGMLLLRNQEVVNSTGIEIDALGRARDRDFMVPLSALQNRSGAVAAATGGAALLRASMLREVGLFDPAYFAYYEDVDLSLRAARRGFTSRYVAEARARHRFAASFGRGSPRQRYLLARGHLRTVALHQPPLAAAALVPLTVLYRLAVKAPLELASARPSLALAEVKGAAGGALEALRAFAARVSGRSPAPR